MSFTWTPDAPAGRDFKAAVYKAQFGEGYSQRVPVGINNVAETWPLDFTLRTKAEVVAIVAYLKPKLGVTNFPWTSPAGDAIKVICTSLKDSYYNDQNCSVSATFEQVFEA